MLKFMPFWIIGEIIGYISSMAPDIGVSRFMYEPSLFELGLSGSGDV